MSDEKGNATTPGIGSGPAGGRLVEETTTVVRKVYYEPCPAAAEGTTSQVSTIDKPATDDVGEDEELPEGDEPSPAPCDCPPRRARK